MNGVGSQTFTSKEEAHDENQNSSDWCVDHHFVRSPGRRWRQRLGSERHIKRRPE